MSCYKELKTHVAKKLAEESKRELFNDKFRLGTNYVHSRFLIRFVGREHCPTCADASNIITYLKKI